MKKISLVFSTLVVSLTPILAVSCKVTSKDKGGEIKEDPIPPDYNLKEYLTKINKFQFERQYPSLNPDDWTFENSWFEIFETENSLVSLEYLQKNEKSTIHEITLKESNYTNNKDQIVTIVHPIIKGSIPYDKETKLFSTNINLNINHDFYITEPHLSFYQYNLEKNSIVNSQKSEEFEIVPKGTIVPPKRTVRFYAKLQLIIDKFDVILNFKMRNNTTILTKIQNKSNEEVKFMRYSFENLLKEAENNDNRYEILEDKNSFLRRNEKGLIEVNLEGKLEMIKSWKIIQGEEDVD